MVNKIVRCYRKCVLATLLDMITTQNIMEERLSAYLLLRVSKPISHGYTDRRRKEKAANNKAQGVPKHAVFGAPITTVFALQDLYAETPWRCVPNEQQFFN